MELKSSIDQYYEQPSKEEKRTQLKHLLDDLSELLTKDDLLDIDTRKQLLDILRELNSKPVNCNGGTQVGHHSSLVLSLSSSEIGVSYGFLLEQLGELKFFIKY